MHRRRRIKKTAYVSWSGPSNKYEEFETDEDEKFEKPMETYEMSKEGHSVEEGHQPVRRDLTELELQQ